MIVPILFALKKLYIPFFLCWGSFLNVLAYRLINGTSLLKPRSFCPHCQSTIYWYDNIPVLSWLLLLGKCRFCKKTISWLYPFVEITTVVLLSYAYWYFYYRYFFAYFIFISALIVTIRSDIETMLISRYVTLFLVPTAFIFSWLNMLPITLSASMVGAVFGYLFLLLINSVFKYFTNKDGIGEGDFDLLCLIGAFTGVFGCWASITIGSTLGSIFGLMYMLYIRYCTTKTVNTQIPFGPFLAAGALVYIFCQAQLIHLLDYLSLK